MNRRCISVVLPVYNEHKNIAECLRRLGGALAGHEHEILVCYDFDQDTTLPAIAEMSDKPPGVRLVKNDFGRGAANALRAGFKAAEGDVIVTTMADLSDPPELIPAMAAKMRDEDAAVVAGSRYCRGGSQTGGPWLKRTLSRIAGISLKWLAGTNTADATNNFRAYSRSFIDTVRIESKQGFEIALELTVKAQLAGLRITEIPSSWTDRTAGESRFRMWKWMPNYLRWYWAAMTAPLFVWAVWLASTISGHYYVRRFASTIPYWDDLEMAAFVGKKSYVPLSWWWSAHNEHRIPLPRVFFQVLMRWFEDFRSLMWCEVYMLSLVSLAMILVARKLRGRTSYTDAFFPLLWLSWGNAENLLMGHQVSLILPSAITCAILLLIAAGPRLPTMGHAIGVGLCLFSLPLNGAPGLTPAPAIILWCLYAGWMALRSGERRTRRAGWTLIAFALATVALIGVYFIDFPNPRSASYNASISHVAGQAARFITLAIGPAAREYWPWSGWLVLALSVVTIVMLLQTFVARPEERVRIAGIFALAGGIVSMAIATGLARGGVGTIAAFAGRYVTLPSPYLCCIFFAWVLYGSPAIGRLVRVVLYSVCLGLLFYNINYGEKMGDMRRTDSGNFMNDLQGGMSIRDLSQKHWRRMFNEPDGLEFRLGYLHRWGITPLSIAPSPDLESPYFMFEAKPVSATGTATPKPRRVGMVWVLVAQPECALHYDIPKRVTRIEGHYGMHPDSYRQLDTAGARFTIELLGAEGESQVLWEQILRPEENVMDRGPKDLALELPPRTSIRRLILRTSFGPGQGDANAWAYWSGIAIR